jgi:hypothetical protein
MVFAKPFPIFLLTVRMDSKEKEYVQGLEIIALALLIAKTLHLAQVIVKNVVCAVLEMSETASG